jgi:hypothetical protein
LGKKAKFMAAILTAAEGLNLAAEVLDTIQKRSVVARKNTQRMVSSLRDNTADVAGQIVDTVNKRWRRQPSFLSRALPFAAGIGVGVGAALLFAPMPGSELRTTLYKKVSRSDQVSDESPRTGWAVNQ